jgi:hypothetical protein
MRIKFTDGNTSGVCEDEVIFQDGRKAEISFSFEWDEESHSFPRITNGELKDRFGLIGRFTRFGNLGDWEILDKDFKNYVSKILSDTLAVLRANLTNGVVNSVY